MKFFSLLVVTVAVTIALIPTPGRSWSILRQLQSQSPSGSSFIAAVRFTIRNLTSSWMIPASFGTRTATTTVRTTQTAIRLGATSTKRPRTRPTTPKTTRTTASTTTTTTPTTEAPYIHSVELIKEPEASGCNIQSCVSDDVEVLEKCDDFCLHLVMNASDTVPSTEKETESTILPAQDYGKGSSTASSDTVSVESNSCDELPSKCTCHYDLAPVCGSNAKTYSNLCEMECAQKCSPGLKLAHVGSCEKWRLRS